MISLKLYIVNHSPRSQQRLEQLRQLLDGGLKPGYTLAVIDVLEDPDAALFDDVLVTPTLIKLSPEPATRVVGDLTDWDNIRSALGLEPHAEARGPGAGK